MSLLTAPPGRGPGGTERFPLAQGGALPTHSGKHGAGGGAGGVSLLVACYEISRTYGTGRAATVALQPTVCEVEPGARIAVTGPSDPARARCCT